MNRTLLVSLIGIAGLAVGIFAGQWVGVPSSREIPRGDFRSKRSPGRMISVKEEQRNFASLLKNRMQRNESRSDLGREMARLSVGELKRLMEETAARISGSEVDSDFERILDAAGVELFRREGEAAYEWLAALPVGKAEKKIATAVLKAGAFEQPLMSKPWIDRLRIDYGAAWGQELLGCSIKGAASRDADELVKVLESLRGESSGLFSDFGDFGADFDFRKLVHAFSELDGTQKAVTRWAAMDREAAWAGIMAAEGDGGARFTGLFFTGISGTEGSEKAAEWIAKKVDEVPDAMRSKVLNSLALRAESVKETVDLIGALAADSDRVAFTSALVRPFAGKSDHAEAAMEILTPEMQAGAMVASAENYRRTLERGTTEEAIQKVLNHYDAAAEKFGLPPAVREQVREALGVGP